MFFTSPVQANDLRPSWSSLLCPEIDGLNGTTGTAPRVHKVLRLGFQKKKPTRNGHELLRSTARNARYDECKARFNNDPRVYCSRRAVRSRPSSFPATIGDAIIMSRK